MTPDERQINEDARFYPMIRSVMPAGEYMTGPTVQVGFSYVMVRRVNSGLTVDIMTETATDVKVTLNGEEIFADASHCCYPPGSCTDSFHDK